jgi:hypothetical protein
LEKYVQSFETLGTSRKSISSIFLPLYLSK